MLDGHEMKALVTGATGFIGGNLVQELLRQGFQVRALVKPNNSLHNLAGLEVELVYGDVRDRSSLRPALRGCDVLFHLAACYHLWVPDPRLMYEVNVGGTRNVLSAALEEGVERAVYTSTAATVGIPSDGRPGTEETPMDPRDLVGHYKRSKYQAEQEALRICSQGLPLVIVNPTTPVGPGDIRPTPTGKIILDFLRGRMLAYVDTGLNLIDVEDVAKGHLLALERGRIGERYILGHRNLTLQEVFHMLEEVSGIRAPKHRLPLWLALGIAYVDEFIEGRLFRTTPWVPVVGVKMAAKPMYFDASKAVRELGLPQSPIEEALAKAVRWFRAHGYV